MRYVSLILSLYWCVVAVLIHVNLCAFNYSKILSSRNKAHLSFLKQTFISANTHPGPVPGSDAKSMPHSLVIFSVSASPSFISRWLYINATCHVWPTLAGASGPTHLGQGRRARREDGRSERKQSLSLSCQPGSGALWVCVRPRPQDKNVFDIVCNCVMFTLLVSEGACISKQPFDCRLWSGWSIPFAIQRKTTRSLDAGLADGP